MVQQFQLEKQTSGRRVYDVTNEIKGFVTASNIEHGLCHLFLLHTSASLIICENADPQVYHDLEAFMARLVVDGDPLYKHIAEGKDDMPSHVRSILTATFLTVPIQGQQLILGRWQGLYLWEHRLRPHHRKIIVTIMGQ